MIYKKILNIAILFIIIFISLSYFLNYTVNAGEDMDAYTYNYLTLKNIKDKNIITVILKSNGDYENRSIIYNIEKKEIVKPENTLNTEKNQSLRDLRYDYTWNIHFSNDENMVTLGCDYGSFYNEWIIQFSNNTEKKINIDNYKKDRFDCTDITYDLTTEVIVNDIENKLIAEKEREHKSKVKVLITVIIVLIVFIIIFFVVKKRMISPI